MARLGGTNGWHYELGRIKMALTYGRQQSTAPEVMSDEDLYQMTGSWEAAAAMRDEQNNALNQYNWSQPTSDSGLSLQMMLVHCRL